MPLFPHENVSTLQNPRLRKAVRPYTRYRSSACTPTRRSGPSETLSTSIRNGLCIRRPVKTPWLMIGHLRCGARRLSIRGCTLQTRSSRRWRHRQHSKSDQQRCGCRHRHSFHRLSTSCILRCAEPDLHGESLLFNTACPSYAAPESLGKVNSAQEQLALLHRKCLQRHPAHPRRAAHRRNRKSNLAVSRLHVHLRIAT